MDSDEVLESLDSLWFYSNVLTSMSISTSPVSDEDHRSSVNEKVWSWLQDTVEEEEALEDESKAFDDTVEESTLLAMVMSDHQPSKSLPRKKSRSKKKKKSVKNELYERKRNVLAEIEYEDYVRWFERCCRVSDNDQFYGPWYKRQTAKFNVV